MKAKYLCLALLVVCASCNRSQPSAQGPAQLVVSPHADTNSPRGRAALAFAHALTDGGFAATHNQLSASLKSSLSAEKLKKNYEEMIGAYDSPPSLVDLTTTMDVWPGKQENDIGWAYVRIAGKDGAEAVTVVIANENGSPVVRSLEWGRP
jgi:serine protease inhibitor